VQADGLPKSSDPSAQLMTFASRIGVAGCSRAATAILRELELGRVNTAKTNLHRANKHAGRSNPSNLPSQKEFVGI
jgi:hypothetical protein